jgi:hypothetical protein
LESEEPKGRFSSRDHDSFRGYGSVNGPDGIIDLFRKLLQISCWSRFDNFWVS